MLPPMSRHGRLRLAAFIVAGSVILVGSTIAGIRDVGENRSAEAKADKRPGVYGSLHIVRK